MKLLGFDSRKNKLFWEGLGFALLMLTMIVISLLFYFFDLPELERAFKTLGFVLSLVFFTGIIFSLYRLSEVKSMRFQRIASLFKTEKKQDLKPNTQRWKKIKNHFQSVNPSEWRIAIIDADALLEELITSLGYQGNSFGEKLKSIQEKSSWVDDAWYVHRLRNNLAHKGSLYFLSEREVYQAFKIYENIFHMFHFV